MGGLGRVLLGLVTGTIAGGFAGYWLRWLQWEIACGRRCDHSFDYGWGVVVFAGSGIGAVLGIVLGRWGYFRR